MPTTEAPPESHRAVPLLLYDLWNDPMCLYSLHEERPDLVEKYTGSLPIRVAQLLLIPDRAWTTSTKAGRRAS